MAFSQVLRVNLHKVTASTACAFDIATLPHTMRGVSDSENLQRSPLHAVHLELGARMVPFAGWEMPVQYSGIVEEHKAVRERAGVFDISHMGQFLVSGRDGEAFLNRALTNNISKLAPGQGQYTLMLNAGGGVIDDLIAYRTSDREFFLVVNASMIREDWKHLHSLAECRSDAPVASSESRSGAPAASSGASDAPVAEPYDIQIANASSLTGGLAIQGPRSRAVFKTLFGDDAVYPEKNTVAIAATSEGIMWLCGTGYTGEDGFEFFMPESRAEAWFRKSIEAVKAEGGTVCGLGARDTLRLEMGYPLNGNDLSQLRSPLQAGLGFFVDLEKGDFIGRDALLKQKVGGLPDKLTAFRMIGAAPPPRPHYTVLVNGEPVTEIASGGLSPSLNQGIGMAYLPLEASKPGNKIEIEIRGRRFPAETCKKPFYQKPVTT
jgi:aminomethyltransferase